MTAIAREVKTEQVYRRGIALVLLAGVCWSSIGLVIRLMQQARAWQVLFYRSIALCIFLLILIAVRNNGHVRTVFRKAGLSAVLGGLALVMTFSGGVVAIMETTVANAMFLLFSTPFFAACLGYFILGESIRCATWITMSFAGIGISIIVLESISVGNLSGNLAAILSALGFALFTVALRWGQNTDMLPVVFFGGIFTIIFAGSICLITGQEFQLPIHDIGLAFTLGVFQLGVGLAFYTLGSKALPAAELALLSMSEVLLGPFWVWLVLDEMASSYTLLGGAVLLAAIVGNALFGMRQQPFPPTFP